MVEVNDIMEVLKNCYDPELFINVVDLGLIYDVKIENDKAYISMTLTAIGCPAAEILPNQIMERVKGLGFTEVKINIVWDPPWTTDKMTEEGRMLLGI